MKESRQGLTDSFDILFITSNLSSFLSFRFFYPLFFVFKDFIRVILIRVSRFMFSLSLSLSNNIWTRHQFQHKYISKKRNAIPHPPHHAVNIIHNIHLITQNFSPLDQACINSIDSLIPNSIDSSVYK